MTRLAEFRLAAGDFPLGRLFDDRPEATLELDRVVPSGDTVMPYFWVHDAGGDMAGVLAVLEEVPELRSATLMDDAGERGLFRAEWKPAYIGIMGAIAEAGVTVVAASGSADGWTFELRASDPDQLQAFQEYCTHHEIAIELTRLSRLSEIVDGDETGLTDDQREALVLAYSEGYYEEPRRADQSALAENLGVSRQALAGRLRRGHRCLVREALVETDTD